MQWRLRLVHGGVLSLLLVVVGARAHESVVVPEAEEGLRVVRATSDSWLFDRSPVPTWFTCVACDHCGGGDQEHELFPDGIRSIPPGDNHVGECWMSGPCADWHLYACGPDEEALPDLTALWTGLRHGMPASEVASILRRWSSVVELNYARAALQVSGCDGLLVGHLPLSRQDAELIGRLVALE